MPTVLLKVGCRRRWAVIFVGALLVVRKSTVSARQAGRRTCASSTVPIQRESGSLCVCVYERWRESLCVFVCVFEVGRVCVCERVCAHQ